MGSQYSSEIRGPRFEERLIKLILAGETALFCELIRPYRQQLLRVALRVVANQDDAEDVVQDSLLKAFVKLHTFRADARLSTWLTSITINQARMLLRERGRARLEPIDDHFDSLSTSGKEASPASLAERWEWRELVHRAASRLKPKYRRVFVLRDLEEFSTAGAAKELGITVPMVKTHLHRARKVIHQELTKMVTPCCKASMGPNFQRPRTVEESREKLGITKRANVDPIRKEEGSDRDRAEHCTKKAQELCEVACGGD